MSEERKMAFWEICKGNFAKDIQREFEKAQRVSVDRGVKTSLKVSISFTPPKPDEERFGGIVYEVDVKTPARKSREYITEISDGAIIADGDSELDVLQEKLDLDIPKPNNAVDFPSRQQESGQ